MAERIVHLLKLYGVVMESVIDCNYDRIILYPVFVRTSPSVHEKSQYG